MSEDPIGFRILRVVDHGLGTDVNGEPIRNITVVAQVDQPMERISLDFVVEGPPRPPGYEE